MKGSSLLIRVKGDESLMRCVVQGKVAEKRVTIQCREMIRQEEGEREPHEPGAVGILGADGRWWKLGHS